MSQMLPLVLSLVMLLCLGGRVEAIGIRPHIPLTQTTGVHFVSTTGAASGPGTRDAPWTLTYAFSGAGGQLTAGETVWIRVGTYSHGSTPLTITATGTSTQPIIFRAYPTERVTLEWTAITGVSGVVLATSTEYVWLWDLEFRNTATGNRTQALLADHDRGHGLYFSEPGMKVINCILHDWNVAVGFWAGCEPCEVYGSLLYYQGMHVTSPTDRDTGYGTYLQTANVTTGKSWIDNIHFKNYAYAVHAYGSDTAYFRNIRFEGNAFFATGQISPTPLESRTFLLGGEDETHCTDNTLVNNYWYGPRNAGGGGMFVGFNDPCYRTRIFGNYVFDRSVYGFCTTFDVSANNVTAAFTQGTVMTGNTLCSNLDDLNNGALFAQFWPSNTYVDTDTAYPTSGNLIVLRPNVYEPGRAHIIVYNWTLASSVSVDLAPANFVSGDTYAIYDAQDYFGPAVASGTYTESAVAISMTNTAVATPYGTVGTAPVNTAPQFGAFVLKKTN